MEGSRPVLCEIQALVAPSLLGTPRRAVVGWDGSRHAMVLAVLEARCGVRLGASDVYLNVAGGLRIGEPAADLAVAAALLSALTGRPLEADGVFFGEISLSGAVRAVGQDSARTREAERLGFTQATVPRGAPAAGSTGIRCKPVGDLAALVASVAGPRAGGASTLTTETHLAAATAA
jgi:DNA repair protein RadA/Sms